MHLKNKGIGKKALFGIFLFLFVTAGSLIKLSVLKSGDTVRIKHINSIATSIRANSLEKEEIDKYFYPTHFALSEILRKGNFDIPSPYDNICYYVGTVQNQARNSSDFIVMTWGTSRSTLDDNNPGIIFETSSPLLNKVITKMSPTIDKYHFECKKTKHIPWKKDMSPLVKINLFPSHWLKINHKKQICLGLSDQKYSSQLTPCIPEEDT